MSTTAKHRAPARRTYPARQLTFAALYTAGTLAVAVHLGLEAGLLLAPSGHAPGGGWLFAAGFAFTGAETTRRPDRDTYAAG